MPTPWSPDLGWWITAVELPVLAGLFWLIWKNRREQDDATDILRHYVEQGFSAQREALAEYKLEVAKSYASIGYIKDVERRLTEHLVRIETKLDGVSMGAPGGRS
ncbi:MAG: hypothetical protein HZC25_10350 [Rhodospirillales bacterium]|nr:hypothetical protein [Rhodospirillales bacterium]